MAGKKLTIPLAMDAERRRLLALQPLQVALTLIPHCLYCTPLAVSASASGLGALGTTAQLLRQHTISQDALYLRQNSFWEISGRLIVLRVSLLITPSLTSS